MGKLMSSLQGQLKTMHKEDAEKCIVIYEHLKEKHNGKVWESSWEPLVSTSFEGEYPNNRKVSKPTYLGELLIKSLEKVAIREVEQTHNKLREILRDHGNQEWGDCIIDEICNVFSYPTTIDINPEN